MKDSAPHHAASLIARAILAGAASLGLAACGAVASGGVAPSASMASADGPLSHPNARITFIHPWFTLPDGNSIGSVGVIVDGERRGSCDHAEQDKAVVCVDKLDLAPGRHFLRVEMFQSRPTQDGPFHQDDVFAVSAFDDVTYDLSRAGPAPAAYISRTNVVHVPTACERDLYAIASAGSCTATELSNLLPIVSAAQQDCRAAPGEEPPRAGVALAVARANVVALRVARCFPIEQIDGPRPGRGPASQQLYLPEALTVRLAPEGFWSRETVDTGSWDWARDVQRPLPDIRQSAPTPTFADELRTFAADIVTVRDRQAMLDDFIPAWLVHKLPLPAIEKALRAPFNLDPRTIEGQRLTLLLRVGWPADPSTYYDPRLAHYLASAAPGGRGLTCDGARGGLAVDVLNYIGRMERTPEYWASVRAIILATPPNELVCDDLSRRALAGPEEEMRWFATWECDPARGARVRGERSRWYLSDERNPGPEARHRLQHDLAACLAR